MEIEAFVQFIRRCDKIAILDHGKFQYFGPFNPVAVSILAKYLPVPEEDTAGAPKKQEHRVVAQAKKAAPKIEAKPKTSLSMLAGAWELLKAGRAWFCLLALSFGVLSQSTRQMSDFWIRYWSKDR
jgi:hypothetical protein